MLTHVDTDGKAKMVDVTKKNRSERIAYAGGWIYTGKKILDLIKENEIKKGDVLNTSKIAGILAAKKTGDLIPLCHPLNLTYVDLKFQIDELTGKIYIFSEVRIDAKTGVEMEALTAVNIAALTIYDMCKGVDKKIFIGESYLIKKTGGKSGIFRFKEKIKGKIVDFNKEREIEVIGFLPEHLEDGDTLLIDNKLETKVKIIDSKIIIPNKIKLEKGVSVCLK